MRYCDPAAAQRVGFSERDQVVDSSAGKREASQGRDPSTLPRFAHVELLLVSSVVEGAMQALFAGRSQDDAPGQMILAALPKREAETASKMNQRQYFAHLHCSFGETAG